VDVDAERLARATAIATIVSSATKTGAPLCIPGTREMGVRVTRQATGAVDAAAAVAPGARPATDDVELREYQRSGGGAPSERNTAKRATAFDWLLNVLR
jgi:hypothetical protein